MLQKDKEGKIFQMDSRTGLGKNSKRTTLQSQSDRKMWRVDTAYVLMVQGI